MDSKRRMVELHIWDQPFFSELSQTERLFYWFMICKCDNVGIYQHNPKLAAFHCGGEINLQQFVDVVNTDQKRLELYNNGKLWIRDFVRDTWGTIAAGNNLGISCYRLLVKHNLLEYFISEYPNCIKTDSFRDEIQKGSLDLPLPQSRGRAGTINININNSINKGSINNKDNGNLSIKEGEDFSDVPLIGETDSGHV